MRNIIDVLNELISICEDADMMVELKRILDSSKYSAPEMLDYRWNEIQQCLYFFYSKRRDALWFQKSISIFSTINLEEVQEKIAYEVEQEKYFIN